MKIVFYSSSSQFQLSEEEFKNFMKAIQTTKKVFVSRLGVFLSDMFIWAGEAPLDPNRRVLHDGSVAIKKFGTWVDENDHNVKISLKYYPELAKDATIEELERPGDKKALPRS